MDARRKIKQAPGAWEAFSWGAGNPQDFKMKPNSIGSPDIYLGTKLKKTRLENGVEAWGMSPSKYVQEAVRNVEEQLKKGSKPGLSKRASTPLPAGYVPELDVSRELNPVEANYYQSQIGILRWMVEIGRVDIITEVSVLSSHLALPREGHLEAVYHIFAYLRKKHNSRMVFDPCYPNIDMTGFKECDWKNFYGDVKEAILHTQLEGVLMLSWKVLACCLS